MRLKVILNRIEKHAGFVYTEARLVESLGKATIEVGVRARANGRAICSGCERRAPGYDLGGRASRGGDPARLLRLLGAERAARIRYVCSDMWKPCLNVIQEMLPRAIHVLDRFHIVQKMNKAIDEVRAQEARKLKEAGAEPVLAHSRWCLLKRPRNLTDKQESRLLDLVRH